MIESKNAHVAQNFRSRKRADNRCTAKVVDKPPMCCPIRSPVKKSTHLLFHTMKRIILALALSSIAALAQDAAVVEVELKPSPANPMMWDKVEFSAKPGQKVKLTVNNVSTVPLPHNFVLTKPGKDMVIGNAALAMAADPTAMAKSYIPEASKADIIAFTKLVQPNTKEVVEFTAPAEAGDYPYICTFPGHFLLMKGVLHVK